MTENDKKDYAEWQRFLSLSPEFSERLLRAVKEDVEQELRNRQAANKYFELREYGK